MVLYSAIAEILALYGKCLVAGLSVIAAALAGWSCACIYTAYWCSGRLGGRAMVCGCILELRVVL